MTRTLIAILNVGRDERLAGAGALMLSTRMCRFLPLIFLPASYPCGINARPPFSRFHAWLSMMAAVGLPCRCARSRHCS